MATKVDPVTTPLASVGIDIGKEIFHVFGLGTDGKTAFRWKIKRLALKDVFEKIPPCIGDGSLLECALRQPHAPSFGTRATDYPSNLRQAFREGTEERLQRRRGEAEAALRPNLHIVQAKTQDQLDLQACHRVRSRLVSRRTAPINQIRAFLIEQGIAVRSGTSALRNSLFEILKNRKDEIWPRMATLIVGLYEDWLWLDERIETVTGEIKELSQSEANCRRLMSIPGIEPLISTGLVAAIGTGEAFGRGRDFGAWLGLVPRQYTTGG